MPPASGLALVLVLQGPVPVVVPARDPGFRQDATLELTYLRGAIGSPDGGVLLIDAGLPGIERLDASGRRLAPIARQGSGPGEVRGPGVMGWVGDTLWIADLTLRRITYFSPALTFLGSEPDAGRCGFPPWALLADGRCLVMPQQALPPSSVDPPAFALLLRARAAGGRGFRDDTLGLISPERLRLRIRFADAEVHTMQSFGDAPLVVASSDGRRLAWVERSPVPGAHPPRVLVRVRELPGGVRREFAVEYRPQPLRDRAVDSVVDRFRPPPGVPAGVRDSVRRRLLRPRTLPPFSAALFDDLGRLWLREPLREGAPLVEWRVFGAGGAEEAVVRLPPAARILFVHGERILAAEMDADDVPVLWQYRLQR